MHEQSLACARDSTTRLFRLKASFSMLCKHGPALGCRSNANFCKCTLRVQCHTRSTPPQAALPVQRNRTASSAALQRRRAALVDVDSAACDDAALLRELAALKALSVVTLPVPVEAAPEPEPCLLDPAAGDPWGGVPRLS